MESEIFSYFTALILPLKNSHIVTVENFSQSQISWEIYDIGTAFNFSVHFCTKVENYQKSWYALSKC